MVVAELSMVISSIKTAIQISKNISEISKDAAVNQKAIELQNIILDLQMSFVDFHSRYFELIELKNNIENELKQIKEWKITKSQYDLVEVETGIYVYIPNKKNKSPNPIHYLCTNCFNKQKKSILQINRIFEKGWGSFFCPECKMMIKFQPKHP
jgi:hypothetical protein